MVNFLKCGKNEEPMIVDIKIPRGLDDFLNLPTIFGERFYGSGLAVDVYEKDDKIFVNAEIPGIDKNTLKVNLNSDMLTISGNKKEAHKLKKEDFYRSELIYGEFKRSIKLPFEVNTEQVKAKCEDGILTVELPKSEEKQQKNVNIDFK